MNAIHRNRFLECEMSNYIVTVKQVTYITQITGNAFNPETGTLKRGTLPGVINKLDADALSFANIR